MNIRKLSRSSPALAQPFVLYLAARCIHWQVHSTKFGHHLVEPILHLFHIALVLGRTNQVVLLIGSACMSKISASSSDHREDSEAGEYHCRGRFWNGCRFGSNHEAIAGGTNSEARPVAIVTNGKR